jgi:putative spermidine/putrescine transport system permease protein
LQISFQKISAIWFGVFISGALLFIVLPIISVIIMSLSDSAYLTFPPKQFGLRWYRSFFTSQEWIQSTLLSFKVASATAILATLLGTLAGFGLSRGRFRGQRLLQIFMIMPIACPAIVIGLGLYFFLSQIGFIGTPAGLIVAHTLVTLPLVIINVIAVLQGLDEELESAAMTLGARPYRVFMRITLPLMSRGIVVGAIFAFLTSFDEMVLAIFLSGPETVTLPKRMWDGIRFDVNPTLAAASTILIVASTILVLLVEAVYRIRSRLPGAPSNELT